MTGLFRRLLAAAFPPKAVETRAVAPLKRHEPAPPSVSRGAKLRAMTASLRARGDARGRPEQDADGHVIKVRSLKIPEPMPGVVPESFDGPLMAEDAGISASYGFLENTGWDGYGFMGYPVLSDLVQVVEFRKPSEILAQHMTREWIQIKAVDDEDDEQDADENGGSATKRKAKERLAAVRRKRIKVIETELKRLDAQARFCEVFEKELQMGICHMFMDVGQIAGPKIAETMLPLKAKIARNGLRALRIVEPIWTYPNQYNSNNPLAPDFYKPQTWFVQGQEVHQTRLLTFVSRPMPDLLKPAYMFGGMSLTQALWDYVNNWLRTRQSVSDLISNYSTPTLGTDMAAMIEDGGAELMAERAELYNVGRSNGGLMIHDKESEEFGIVAAPLGSLDRLQAQSQEQQSSVASIPLVVMFGITPTGLNITSEGELTVFDNEIKSRQLRVGSPHLKYLIDVIQISKFGDIDESIQAVWQPLRQMTEKERADLHKALADMAGVLLDRRVIDPIEVRRELASNPEGPFSSIDVDDVPEPEAEPDDVSGEEDEPPEKPSAGASASAETPTATAETKQPEAA